MTISNPENLDEAIDRALAIGMERPDPRVAAVMLFVRQFEDGPNLLFIRRSEKVPNHKGQISFPGGGYHAEDDNLEATALREAWEELQLDPQTLKVLGPLPPTPTIVSNFVIHPFVAVPADPTQEINYQGDGFEVAEAFHVPLKALLEPAAFRTETWTIGGYSRPAIFYTYQHNVIWGATAFILHNFLRQIRAGHWQILFE